MKDTIAVDTVLDLVSAHQKALATAVDAEYVGSRGHRLLWEEYKAISELYDAVRKAAI
jgi:hypothetical protein